jgi:hypothetical protein
MKVEKYFAALALSLVVLWASRFAPYSCERLGEIRWEGASTWPAVVGSGFLLTVFLFLLAYDLVSFLTYRLGLEQNFEHLEVYPGDSGPGAQPISLTTKLLVFYPLDLAAVIFLLLPFWIKCAYCS